MYFYKYRVKVVKGENEVRKRELQNKYVVANRVQFYDQLA